MQIKIPPDIPRNRKQITNFYRFDYLSTALVLKCKEESASP